VAEPVPDTPAWSSVTTAPMSRYNFTAGVLNDKLYVVGGYDPAVGNLSRTDCYDNATGTWSTRAAVDIQLQGNLAHGWYNGRLYIAGGSAGGGSGNNRVRCYDPGADTWSLVGAVLPTPVPFGAGGSRHGMIGNKLYVLGGQSGANPITRLLAYDVDAGTWATLAPIPVAVAEHGSAVIDGKLYVVGGWTIGSTNATKKTWRYDPAADTWTALADMPGGRNSSHTVAHFGKLYVIGGNNDNNGGANTNAWRYDPATNTWETLPNPPILPGKSGSPDTPRGIGKGAAVVLGGKVTTVLGRDGYTPNPQGIYRLDGIYDHTAAPPPSDPVWVVDSSAGLQWP
jgi:N-acetylneuraminic acid mutarotase